MEGIHRSLTTLIEPNILSLKPLAEILDFSYLSFLSQVDENLSKGKYLEVEQSLIKAFLLTSNQSEFPIKLGHLMYKQKRYQEAEAYYRQALRNAIESERIEIHFGLGQVYYQSRLYPDSYLAFSFLINSNPAHELSKIAYLKLAAICKKTNDSNNALSLIVKLITQTNPNNKILAEAFCLIGSCYEIQGNLKKSHEFYMKSINLTKNFRTVTCVAWSYLRINPVVTLSACRKYLRKNRPIYEWTDIKFLEAIGQLKLKNFSKSASILEEQLKVYPNNCFYLNLLGVVYYNNKSYTQALQVFRYLASAVPSCEINVKNLCAVYHKLNLHDDALNTYSSFHQMSNLDLSYNLLTEIKEFNVQELAFDITDFPLN